MLLVLWLRDFSLKSVKHISLLIVIIGNASVSFSCFCLCCLREQATQASEMCWMGQKLMMAHNSGDTPEIPSDRWLSKHWHSTKTHSSTNTTTASQCSPVERKRWGVERVCKRKTKNNVRKEAEHSLEHREGKIWKPSEKEETGKK